MINISINNQPFALEKPAVIQNLLLLIPLSTTKGIAVAVNNTVIPKKEWGNFIVNENDYLTIIRATQGG